MCWWLWLIALFCAPIAAWCLIGVAAWLHDLLCEPMVPRRRQ